MADKTVTLEDLARAEAAEAERRETQRVQLLSAQSELLRLVPEKFFVLAGQIRDGVRRFNGAAKLARGLVYSESAAVTTRDTNLNADYVVEVKREANHLVVAMRNMARVGKPDALIIEGAGTVGVAPRTDRFKLRSEGIPKSTGGAIEIVWRTTCEGKAVDTPLEQLGDRLVAVVATGELSRIWTMAPFA